MEMYKVGHVVGYGDGLCTQNHEIEELGELTAACIPVSEYLRAKNYSTKTKVIIDRSGAELLIGEMSVHLSKENE